MHKLWGDSMIPCPKCISSNTFINAEIVHVDRVTFDWKQKGNGVKRLRYSLKKDALPTADVRVFLNCKDCNYYSDNLNGYDDINGFEDEVNLVVDQVEKAIRRTK